ncbi:unnamed protein product [Gadus morhua 'NCC']
MQYTTNSPLKSRSHLPRRLLSLRLNSQPLTVEMENIFRIAFWTIALSWMVLAVPITHSDVIKPEALLRQNVFCPANMSFYTPSMNNHCMKASLQCVISGLTAMIPEHTTMIPELTTKDRCEDDKAKIEQVLDDLENYKDRLPTPSNATACVCAAGASWNDFLGNLTSLLQMYNTMQRTAGDATKG